MKAVNSLWQLVLAVDSLCKLPKLLTACISSESCQQLVSAAKAIDSCQAVNSLLQLSKLLAASPWNTQQQLRHLHQDHISQVSTTSVTEWLTVKARQRSDLDLIKNIASIMHSNSMVETTVGSGGITANLSPASSLSDKRSRQTFWGQANTRFQSGHLITGA